MNCHEIKQYLERYLEGELTDAQQQELREHLKCCDACRQEFETSRKLEVVLKDAFLYPEANEQAADEILTEIEAVSLRAPRRPFLTIGRVAAGVIILIGLTVSFYAGRLSVRGAAVQAAATEYQIVELEGTVLVHHPESDTWQPLNRDSVIYAEDQFLSIPGSRVRFQAAADSYIDLYENSMLVLDITEDRTDLRLIHGSLDADLASPHGPFFVTTPHGRAEALGTEFTVTVE